MVGPSGKRLGSHVVETNAGALIEVLRGIARNRHVCLEEGTLSGWLYEVLEHIEEDRRAIRELRRVYRATGWAVLQVPITAERTFEDPEITDPDERHRVFGQFDHAKAVRS